MDKKYQHKQSEEKIYNNWEKNKLFEPDITKNKEPFTILLPPPNANDPLHVGHALYTVEDILCRWHRMLGEPVLFLPGTDHAGIETQYVFEKKLRKENKSRFDFDRNTLYKMINEYVEENRGIVKKQLKRLGFSLDWSREKYTLDPDILKTVLETFKKLHKDGLVYRGERIVNYCVNCGTAFSNLEIEHIECNDFLYFLDYGPIKIATTRPETIFADVAVAVNPQDKRYKALVNKKAILPLLNKELPIIADDLVDIEFGTGALKITPGHSATDFIIGKKHDLNVIKIIDTNGRLINVPEKYQGMRVKKARKVIIEDLKEQGKLIEIKPLRHSIGTCYRCKNPIEPLTMPQWFVKTKPLAKPAIDVVKNNTLKIVPQRFTKLYLQWMENIEDWNISRQVVWGPRIPAWYCLDCNPEITVDFISEKKEKVFGKYSELKKKYSFSEIKNGIQTITASKQATYFLENTKCPKCQSKNVLQETDTFDTWFSSGQWPLTTLGFPSSEDFSKFYPTSVLDTMWDILFFWVARMIMLGLYRTGEIPFKVAHMHSRVVDAKGKKMSKSKGNVIEPIEMIEKYNTDALRMALVYGVAPASDIALSEEKIRAMRNFTNKIWNAARFIFLMADGENWKIDFTADKTQDDIDILKNVDDLAKSVTKLLEKYRFGQATEEIYQFFWHNFCDIYIEKTKPRFKDALPTLVEVLITSLKLLHPFMPFITEKIYQIFREKLKKENKIFESEYLMISSWPVLK